MTKAKYGRELLRGQQVLAHNLYQTIHEVSYQMLRYRGMCFSVSFDDITWL